MHLDKLLTLEQRALARAYLRNLMRGEPPSQDRHIDFYLASMAEALEDAIMGGVEEMREWSENFRILHYAARDPEGRQLLRKEFEALTQEEFDFLFTRK